MVSAELGDMMQTAGSQDPLSQVPPKKFKKLILKRVFKHRKVRIYLKNYFLRSLICEAWLPIRILIPYPYPHTITRKCR